MEKTYDNYVAQLRHLLDAAEPGVGLAFGANLVAALVGGQPVWFDRGEGLCYLGDFDADAWRGEAWEGQTVEETWRVLQYPRFVRLRMARQDGMPAVARGRSLAH